MKRARGLFMITILLLISACNSNSPIPPIATAETSADKAITTANASTLSEVAEFQQGEIGPVTALAFTPDRTQLRAVHARTPKLRHWSIPEGHLLAEFELESVGLGSAAFDADARSLLLTGAASELVFGDNYMSGITPEQIMGPKNGIEIIDAASGELRKHLPGFTFSQTEYYGIAISQDAHIVVSEEMNLSGQPSIVPDQNRGLHVFAVSADPATAPEVRFSTAHSHSDFAAAFALDSEGRLLAVYAENGLIQLWDLDSQREWGQLTLKTDLSDTEMENYVTQMAIDPTRQWLVTFSRRSGGDPQLQDVTLWRLDERQVQWQTEMEARYVHAFAFNPSGTLLAAGASDGLHLWDVETGAEVKTFAGESVLAVAFSQDGSQLAWGDWVGKIHLSGLPEE